MALNLEKQLLFYGQYHHDPVNVGIHMVFVPILLMTGFLMATNLPALPLPSYLTWDALPPNPGTIATLLYASLYILLEPIAGSLLAPLLLAGTAYANHLTTHYNPLATYAALGIHIFSWIIQFIGHGVFEGRAPALLDNLVQAVFLAPFFVWLEFLFMCGYRPELRQRLKTSVEAEIKKFREGKEKKKEKGSVEGNGKVEVNGNGNAK